MTPSGRLPRLDGRWLVAVAAIFFVAGLYYCLTCAAFYGWYAAAVPGKAETAIARMEVCLWKSLAWVLAGCLIWNWWRHQRSMPPGRPSTMT